MTTYIAYLCLGSNRGDRLAYLQRALDKLQQDLDIVMVSAVYETEPVEMESAELFYNAGVKIETELKPDDLLKVIKKIEHESGRAPYSHLKPREIDIDILMYENFVYHDKHLQVPHPKVTERKFALTVLNEIASDVRHPELNKTISELLMSCKDRSAVVRINSKLNITEQALG